jgi:DeoR family transcriptional regulator of aga operon
MDTHQELPINLRVRAQETKRAIAKAAVRFIPRTPYAVGINGGSTTALVARELGLGGFDQLRIITNSLPVAQLVTSYPAMNITMTGGQLRPESLELVGVLAERSFAAVNLGTAFLGVDGFTTLGATTHDETEASTNRAMVESAQQLIVVADSAKIGRLTMATVATLEQVDVLITDSTTDPQILEQFRQAGVEVVLASA